MISCLLIYIQVHSAAKSDFSMMFIEIKEITNMICTNGINFLDFIGERGYFVNKQL